MALWINKIKKSGFPKGIKRIYENELKFANQIAFLKNLAYSIYRVQYLKIMKKN